MQNNHEIEILNLVVDNSQPEYPNLVVKVLAIVKATTPDLTLGAGYQRLFDISGEPPADTFTAYELLTKEMVMEWLMAPGMADQIAEAYAEADRMLVPPSPVDNLSPPWVPKPTMSIINASESDTNGSPANSIDSSTTSTTYGEALESMVKSWVREVLKETPPQ